MTVNYFVTEYQKAAGCEPDAAVMNAIRILVNGVNSGAFTLDEAITVLQLAQEERQYMYSNPAGVR